MPIYSTEPMDPRQRALASWVTERVGGSSQVVEAISSDASFRRYFRFDTPRGALVAMDAPPQREDCRPFVQVAGMLARAGVSVPRIIAADIERGYLLLSDLGRETYLDVLTPDNADRLFAAAVEALLALQRADSPQRLPPYSEALLRAELALFSDWYLERHLGMAPGEQPREAIGQLSDLLVARALAQGRVLVHRDFMPRNLMVGQACTGVLDFQDAVYGPVSYDPVCLFRDAFVSWPRERVTAWLEQYWSRARSQALPVPDRFETFLKDCDWMGVQRHLKVIGIFARIRYRDGKPRYLEDAPRFLAYLDEVAPLYAELEPLRELLAAVRHMGVAEA